MLLTDDRDGETTGQQLMYFQTTSLAVARTQIQTHPLHEGAAERCLLPRF
jgi:hypothetical protein